MNELKAQSPVGSTRLVRRWYRTEFETGVGWSDKNGNPYPVLTWGQDQLSTLKEARRGLAEWKRDRPLLRGRIIRVEERERVMVNYKPNDSGQACRPEPHNLKQTGDSASPAPTC